MSAKLLELAYFLFLVLHYPNNPVVLSVVNC